MTARTVVLVEGESDAAVVRVLARRHGVDLDGVRLVPAGGATSARRALAALDDPPARVVALCDAGEADHLRRALGELAVPSTLLVCDADLEDELIRATGVDRALAVLEAAGDLRAFRVLQRQPAHRGAPVQRQLHRYIGAGSGRKARIDAALAAALPADAIPPPLAALLAALHEPPGGRPSAAA